MKGRTMERDVREKNVGKLNKKKVVRVPTSLRRKITFPTFFIVFPPRPIL
jgi:hypothetical protein